MFLMYVLGTVCCQHIHRSRIRHLVLSVIGVLDKDSYFHFSAENGFFSRQSCKAKSGTLVEILNERENNKVQESLANSSSSSSCPEGYWFGLVGWRGYMWYTDSGANVTYKNFRSFVAGNESFNSVLYFPVKSNPTIGWKVLQDSDQACFVCQRGFHQVLLNSIFFIIKKIW